MLALVTVWFELSGDWLNRLQHNTNTARLTSCMETA